MCESHARAALPPGDMGSGKRDGTMRIGLDVGSTTLKCVLLNDAGELVFDAYERHFGKTAEKAAELLRSTRLKTGEIGLECGFSDGSYFIKTFREIKHCTPREYRTKFC